VHTCTALHKAAAEVKITMHMPECLGFILLLDLHHLSPAGTAAGVAAGIAVVGILTSQTKARMEKAGVSLTIKDYTELLAKAKADEAKASNGKA